MRKEYFREKHIELWNNVIDYIRDHYFLQKSVRDLRDLIDFFIKTENEKLKPFFNIDIIHRSYVCTYVYRFYNSRCDFCPLPERDCFAVSTSNYSRLIKLFEKASLRGGLLSKRTYTRAIRFATSIRDAWEIE